MENLTPDPPAVDVLHRWNVDQHWNKEANAPLPKEALQALQAWFKTPQPWIDDKTARMQANRSLFERVWMLAQVGRAMEVSERKDVMEHALHWISTVSCISAETGARESAQMDAEPGSPALVSEDDRLQYLKGLCDRALYEQSITHMVTLQGLQVRR